MIALMTNQTLASLIVLLLSIGISVYFFVRTDSKLYAKRFVPILIGGGLVILITLIPFILKVVSGSVTEDFQGVTIKQDDIHTLEIVTIHGRYELKSTTSQEIITYVSLETEFSYKNYEPVYLRSFDDYHMVIYSTNQTNYVSGYFKQTDFAYGSNPDVIVLIHKVSRRLIPIQDSELIGKTYELSLFQMTHNTLLIPVSKPHQVTPIIYMGFTVNPTFLLNGRPYPYYERPMGFEHVDTDSTHIAHIALSDTQILLWVNNLGDVYLEQHTVWFDTTGSSSTIHRRPDSPLKQIEHIQQGHFTVYRGDIYYLDDDLSIKKIINLDTFVTVGSSPSVDDWESYIPEA